MRRLLCVLLFACLPATTLAQTFFVEGNVGANSILAPDPLPDFHNSGVTLGAAVGVRTLPFLEVIVEGEYSQFPFNEDEFLTLARIPLSYDAEAEGSRVSMLSGSVGARLLLDTETSVTPFFTGGVGLYRRTIGGLDFDANGAPIPRGPDEYEQGNQRQTALGYYLEAGIRFRVSSAIGVFFAPRYVTVLTDEELDDGLDGVRETRIKTRYIPVRLGLQATLW